MLARSTIRTPKNIIITFNSTFKRNASSVSENENENDNNKVNRQEELVSAKITPINRKYVQLQQEKVSNTWNIPKKDLYLDMLFNSQGPLLEPVKVEVAEKLFNTPLSRMYLNKEGKMDLKKHPRHRTNSPKTQQQGSTIVEDMKRYRKIRDSHSHSHRNNSGSYHVFFNNKTPAPAPAPATASIFTHSAISQLPLQNSALLNLPHSLLTTLRPFTCSTRAGHEAYRDDRIVVRRIEIEERREE